MNPWTLVQVPEGRSQTGPGIVVPCDQIRVPQEIVHKGRVVTAVNCARTVLWLYHNFVVQKVCLRLVSTEFSVTLTHD